MNYKNSILAAAAIALASLVFGCEKTDGAQPGTTAQGTPEQQAQPNAPAQAGQTPGNFAGNTRVAPVSNAAVLRVPRILWGAEMVSLYANGGKDKTQANSIFAEQGLNVEFTPGDDFRKQVADYKSGASPFLRGTLHMIGLASEELGRDERTKPVVIMQLTWSAGDHMVCRDGIKTLADLRGKKVALQKSGPHMGLLDDALRTATLKWEDVTVAYVDGITGANGPAEAFKRDGNMACAFVVTPDAIALMGDLDKVGTGAEGTVQGAHMVVSTRELSRSIADVYAVRKDWYDANKATVTKFTAGFLKGTEEVLTLKKDYETNGPNKAAYVAKVLKPAQAIFGSSVLPNDDEAHGLLSDAQFVGYQGNIAWFNDANDPVGFAAMNVRAIDLAVSRGFATAKIPLLPSTLEWHSDAFTNYLGNTNAQASGQRFDADRARNDIESMTKKGTVDAHTIFAFTVKFEPGQTEFDSSQYKNEFARALELSRQYGGAIMAIRGHADPTMTLATLVKAGCENGALTCDPVKKEYFYGGNKLNLLETRHVVELVESGKFDTGVQVGPRQVMQQASNLALQRAQAVRESLLKFGEGKVKIDTSQIQAQGVGVLEPIVAKPTNAAEAARNQRVEFRIIRVSAEATKATDFDF